MATVAANVRVAVVFEPPASRAVTVISAVPPDTGVTSTVEPDTDTVATDGDEDDAPYVSASSSGSRNANDTSTVCAPSSTRRNRDASCPTASGGWFATVTENVCVAVVFEPPASRAVTVTVAVPPDTGVTVSVEPDTDAVATDASDDEAPYVSGSLSRSRNAPDTSTVRAPAGTRRRSAGRLPTDSGERFPATVTEKVCVAGVFEPLRSVAVTVTVTVPSETGVTVTVEPDTDTVATDVSDEDASYVSASRSGSRKASDTSTANGSSVTPSALSPSVPTVSGPAFSGTVTANVRVADVFEPLRSVAVTVTVTVPADTGVTVTVEPDARARATEASDEDAP